MLSVDESGVHTSHAQTCTMDQLNAGTSRALKDVEVLNEERYDLPSCDLIPSSHLRVLNDRRKRDTLTRLKASRAAISKRRLHGTQGAEVDWEDKQLCIASGQLSSESYSSTYTQVKQPLTELIENPTSCRKSGNSIGGYCEKYPSLDNIKIRSLNCTVVEDVVPYVNQVSDSYHTSHSSSPKVAVKRVISDDSWNEVLGRSAHKHIFNLNKSNHKGMKFKKSRENLEIRRRHSGFGSYLYGEDFNSQSRRTLWKKLTNCHIGMNNANVDVIHGVDIFNEFSNGEDDRDLIQEKRVRRNSVGDSSFMKSNLQSIESNYSNDHSFSEKYLWVNGGKLFLKGDFATRFYAGEFGYGLKSDNFGEDVWAPDGRNLDFSRLKSRGNEVYEHDSLRKWSDKTAISGYLSMVGQGMSCEVPLNLMANIYSSYCAGNEISNRVNLTKSFEELKDSPIYQSHNGAAIMARKSCSGWPRRRCLPKIPQRWAEGNGSTSQDATIETEEEPLSTSLEVALNESQGLIAVNVEGSEDKDGTLNSEGLYQSSNSSSEINTEDSSSSNEYQASYLPLRVSLFPFVPPYVRFGSHDARGPPVLEDIRSIAKWKLGKFTPHVIQLIIKNTGLDLVRHCDEFMGTWAKNLSPSGFSHVKESQKINHIPGGFYIGRKDSLCNNLKKMKNVYGAAEYYFVPETYVLPADIYFLKQEWDESEEKKEPTKWIVKPPAGARGSGVSVIHSWGQIPHSKPIVVQKYIANPYLIDHTKFDLRVYVLITSVHPLRLYVYSEGLVRFASDTYSPDTSTLSDKYVHLTNYSVNKKSSRYMVNQDPSACQGHKWTLSSLWSYLRARHVNVDGLWKKIIDIAIKTFLSGENAISRCVGTCLNSNYPSYELFGLDIILDAELKPWLLEVNISPSLNTSSKLDMSVKGPMMAELLNLVGYHLPPTHLLSLTRKREIMRQLMERQEKREYDANSTTALSGLLFDRRIYTKALSSEEKRKHLTFTDMSSNQLKYCDSILRILMPDDVRHLLIAEDELSQAKRFQRVYPALGMHKYYKFFNGPRYYNMLYEAWEKRYSNDRKAGIELLQELCRNRLHLRTPISMSSLKFGARTKKLRESVSKRTVGDGSHRKVKDDKKKSSETNFKKKPKERLSVKTKRHLCVNSNPFSCSTSGAPGNKPGSQSSGSAHKTRITWNTNIRATCKRRKPKVSCSCHRFHRQSGKSVQLNKTVCGQSA